MNLGIMKTPRIGLESTPTQILLTSRRRSGKLSVDPHTMNAKAYNEVVARAHLRSIRLLNCKLDMKPEALDTRPSDWRKQVREKIEPYVDQDAGRLYGTFLFELICRRGRKRVFTVAANYLVGYSIQGECDEAAGQLFVERVGRIAAYPYFRGLVSSLVAEAGVTLPPLPIISAAPRTIKSAADLETKGAAKLLVGDR
jgi:preprotein translocase subunit SecB